MEIEQANRAGTRRDLAAFAGLALAFRVAFLVVLPRVVDSADAIHYIRVAEQFARGEFHEFYARIPLLYPALGALCSFAARDLEWACTVVSLVASALLVYPVYRLSFAMHGRAAARVAALTVSIWPWLGDYGCRVAPEALASLLWFLAVWALARSLRDGGLWLIAAPLAFFALHLTRPEGTLLLLAAPIGSLVLCVRGGGGKARRLIPYVVICGMLLAGYVAFMKAAVGEAMINPRVLDAGASLHHVLVERGAETARTFIRLFSEVIPIMAGPFLLIFAGVGLFQPSESVRAQSPRRDLRLELLVLYFMLVQAAVAVLSTYPEPRYIMAVVIGLALWSARGMVVVARQAAAIEKFRWLRAAPVTLLVVLMALGTAAAVAPEYLGRMPSQPREYKLAGRWMKEQGIEPGLILTRKPQVGYYAGMPTVGPDLNASVEQAIAFGKEAGARYLVIDERYTAQMAPGLRPLLDPSNAPPSLKLLKADLSPYPGARIVIYQFIGP